jgi:hypothetical protein
MLDAGCRQRDVRHLVTGLAGDDRLAPEYVGVEAAGALDVIRNDEMGQDHLLVDGAHVDLRCWN